MSSFGGWSSVYSPCPPFRCQCGGGAARGRNLNSWATNRTLGLTGDARMGLRAGQPGRPLLRPEPGRRRWASPPKALATPQRGPRGARARARPRGRAREGGLGGEVPVAAEK